MATRHGSKTYYQLLLDPHRAELLQEIAKEQGKRTTDAMREMLYAHLERVLPSSVYNEAAAKDNAVWKQSVRNRVKGRAKKAEEKVTKE